MTQISRSIETLKSRGETIPEKKAQTVKKLSKNEGLVVPKEEQRPTKDNRMNPLNSIKKRVLKKRTLKSRTKRMKQANQNNLPNHRISRHQATKVQSLPKNQDLRRLSLLSNTIVPIDNKNPNQTISHSKKYHNRSTRK